MKIIVTGAAGFIGAALCQSLLSGGYDVIGIDNHDLYYDVSLKEARVKQTLKFEKYSHFQLDIADKSQLDFRLLALVGSPWAILSGYGNINPLSIDYA